MTYKDDYSIPQEVLEQICEEGFDALPDLIRIMLNTAMQIERHKHLGAGPYERTPERQGYANGYKSKTVATRVGKITLDVPQVREGDFYPNSLEKGIRSERALKLALAEMYVQGVSTRKVAAITERMCGFAVSSSQVSKATAELDEQLQAWRERPFWMPVMRRYVRKAGCRMRQCCLQWVLTRKVSGRCWECLCR